MIGVLPAPASTPCPDIASVQVCTTAQAGPVGGLAPCYTFGPAATFPAPAPDPEALYFNLHRVDVKYTVTPLIPGGAGNFFHLFMPPLTFERQVSMRSMD
jgi:hypothetical protein